MARDYGRNISKVDIEPIGDAPFHASATFQSLPDIGIVSGSRSAASYHITRRHLTDVMDGIGLLVHTIGASTTSQLGREVVCGPGSGVVISGTDPSVRTVLEHGNFMTIVFPRQAMAELVPDLEASYARVIAREHEALQLLVRYTEALCLGGALTMPALAQASATYLTDLAALAIGATADASRVAQGRGAAAARLHAIKADIRNGLADRHLSVATVAAQHHIAPRTVHRLFERDGTTFSAYVLSIRLGRARRMLEDPRLAGRTISAIAFECGFSDLSYFNRTFRRAFHLTPSDLRNAALRAW